MITSNQVSAMMAQQQQQQNMLSMGAPSPVLGASQFPPQFNFGLDSGLVSNRLSGGGGFMGGVAAGTSALGSGLGTAASTAGMLSMFGIGGQTIGGGMGAMLGLNPLSLSLMAAAAPAMIAGGGMMQGNQVNANVGAMLSSAGFANPMSPNGFGFGFADQTRMSQQIIGMGTANPFVNTQEQTQLLNKFQQMGLDKGLTSMDKMMDKFKEFSKTTEEVAVQLGKTVGEVTGIVGQLKGQGFFSASEVTGVTNRMAAGANYGLTMGQQMQMAGNMASMARGQGMSGQAGALVGMNLAQGFGASMSIDNLNSTLAMDLTGTTNTADASAALGQQVGGALMSQFNRGGRLSPLLSGLIKEGSDGQLVLDQDALSQAASGEMSISDIRSRGSDLLTSSRLKGAFANSQTRLASDLLKTQEGSTAAFGLLRGIAKEESAGQGPDGMSEEDVFVNLARTYGIANEQTARLLYDYIDDLEETSNKKLMDEANYAAAQKRRAYLSREASVEALKRKFGHEVDKALKPAGVSNAFVSASNNFGALVNQVERSAFGLEIPASALFTQQGVQNTLDDFMSGNLNQINLQAGELEGSIFGQADREYRARIGAASGLRYDDFAKVAAQTDISHVTGDIDQGLLDNFLHHTSDATRNSFYGSNTGALGNAALGFGVTRAGTHMLGSGMKFGKFAVKGLDKLGFKGKLAAGALQLGMGALGFGMSGTDEEGLYDSLMQDAKSKGATTESEAHAMIAKSPEGAAALQRHLSKYGAGEGFDLTSMAKAEYMSAANQEGGDSMIRTGMGVVGGLAGTYLGAAAVGASSFGLGSIAGGVAGGYAGEALGTGLYDAFDYMMNSEERDMREAGHGAKLLAKLGTKEQLRNLDKIYKDALLANGGDENKARVETAKRLSDLLGEPISSTDVQSAMADLQGATGMDHDKRISGNSYDKALDLTKKAKTFQQQSIFKEHLSELGAALVGEDDERITALREAAMGGDTAGSLSALREISKASMEGDFTYEGDVEAIKKAASAGAIFKDIEGLEGRDVSDLDSLFGKGRGKKLRQMAGIQSGGKLSKLELKEIAQIQAGLEGLSTLTPGAAQGLASTGAAGDSDLQRLTTSTTNLVGATEKLAGFVDNIGANLLNKEPVGSAMAPFETDD